MATSGWWHRARESVAYRSRWLVLSLFGPATLDDEHDPVQQLKVRYGRRPPIPVPEPEPGPRAVGRTVRPTPDELATEVWEDESPEPGHTHGPAA